MSLKRRKVLIFTDWYLPGYKAGGPIQSCKNIVETLYADFDLYIYTSDRDLGDDQPYDGVELDRWINLSENVFVCYSSLNSRRASAFKRIIREVEPQVVYLNSMFSFYYTIRPLLYLRSVNFNGQIILAPRGMLHRGAISLKSLKKKVFLKLLSISGITRKIHFHATDEQEVKDIKMYFSKVGGITHVENIPNTDPCPWVPRSKTPGSVRCIFVSRIHPKKNLHNLFSRLPELDGKIRVDFDVYGTCDNEEYLIECKKLAAGLPSNITINFKGALPHDKIFQTLHEYHLFVLPTLGENFGHAIFEAMSAGCPVLISNQTPWRNLESYNAGWSVSLDNLNVFVEKISDVAKMDETRFNILSQATKNYAQEFIRSKNYRSDYIKLFSL